MADATNERVLRTPLARVSYPALITARPAKGKPGEPPPKPKWGSTLIFDDRSRGVGLGGSPNAIRPDTKKIWETRMPPMLAAVAALGQERWPKEYVAAGAPWFDNQGWKSPWLDGGLPKYVTKDGMGPGVRFIRPSSNRPIPCVGKNGQPITTPDLIYPGCYCYGLLAPFFYSNPENHGVSWGLRGVQFVEDGERLDDSVDIADYFEALEGDEMPTDAESALAQMFKV